MTLTENAHSVFETISSKVTDRYRYTENFRGQFLSGKSRKFWIEKTILAVNQIED